MPEGVSDFPADEKSVSGLARRPFYDLSRREDGFSGAASALEDEIAVRVEEKRQEARVCRVLKVLIPERRGVSAVNLVTFQLPVPDIL